MKLCYLFEIILNCANGLCYCSEGQRLLEKERLCKMVSLGRKSRELNPIARLRHVPPPMWCPYV